MTSQIARLSAHFAENEYFISMHIYAQTGILTHNFLDFTGTSRGLSYCSDRKSGRPCAASRQQIRSARLLRNTDSRPPHELTGAFS